MREKQEGSHAAAQFTHTDEHSTVHLFRIPPITAISPTKEMGWLHLWLAANWDIGSASQCHYTSFYPSPYGGLHEECLKFPYEHMQKTGSSHSWQPKTWDPLTIMGGPKKYECTTKKNGKKGRLCGCQIWQQWGWNGWNLQELDGNSRGEMTQEHSSPSHGCLAVTPASFL